jgi:hypothetical protein
VHQRSSLLEDVVTSSDSATIFILPGIDLLGPAGVLADEVLQGGHDVAVRGIAVVKNEIQAAGDGSLNLVLRVHL